MRVCLPLAVLAMVAVTAVPAVENIDPADDGSQYVWGENVGWINLEPSGNGGPGVEVLDDRLIGWAWAENVGWINLSCENNTTCGTVDFRVTNDGGGTLSGYAWSENGGWVSFSCANQASCGTVDYGVTIDGYSGEFAGRAWAENLGWISFASDGPAPFRVRTGWCASQDLDADTFTGCTGDCDDGNADTYTGAPETNDGLDNQCGTEVGAGLVDEIGGTVGYPTPGDKSTFCWDAQAGATAYEVARSIDPTFATGCVLATETTNCHTDATDPSPGDGYHYLVRASAPNVGSWGLGQDGQERAFTCP